MYRIELPWLDASLSLTPRWGDLSGATQVLVALACLAPLGLAAWLYRYELRLVSRGMAFALLLIRMAVLSLLIFMIGLQPIVAHSVAVSRVLVAVDASESMTVADPQRPSGSKLRLARALHLTRDLCTDNDLERWIAQYDKDGAVVLTDDERRLYDQVCQRVDGLTRLQTAQRLLTDDGLGLLKTIAGKHHVELIGFGRETWDIAPTAITLEPPKNGVKTEAGTDLRLPLARAVGRSGAGKIIGIVLLTDGQHNWGPSPAGKAGIAGERPISIPIYPIPLGYRQGPPLLALAGVKAPPAVFKDVDTTIEIQVKVIGIKAQDLSVELQRDKQPVQGEPVLESLGVEKIRHDGQDRTYTVPFRVSLTEAGTQVLRVAVRPGDAETARQPWPNSRRVFPINVTNARARVLLIDGEARWEHYYLATALGRDRTIQLDRVLFEQPSLGLIAEEELAKIGQPARSLPADADALAKYDCIILGDVAPEQLPPADRERLEKFVADRGGTLVLAAGKRFLPLAYLGATRAGAETDPLLKLLPILQPHNVATQFPRGFRIHLTHEGELAPYLQMDPVGDASAKIWSELPGHFWGVVGPVKPGAVALAGFVDPARGDAKPANGRSEAVIARQNYGFGRVVYVGLDSTWRWRFKIGDTYHHRFWGQLIRWAASDQLVVGGNDQIRFGTREPLYREGQEVELMVRLGETVGPLRAGEPAGARIIRIGEDRKEETIALVPLAPVEAQPRVLEGRLRDLPAGDYRIEPVLPGLENQLRDPDSPSERMRSAFRVAPPQSTEMIELSVNLPLLEELAARSGGKVFAPEDARALADLLIQQPAVQVVASERKLWQEWGTLVCFLVLLTSEWVCRKWAGLP